MNQPKLPAVEQQADGDLRFLQQPLEALLRCGVPPMTCGVPVGVKIPAPLGIWLAAGVAPLGEVEHQGLQALAFELGNTVRGAQGFAVFGQHHLGHACKLSGSHQIGVAPIEKLGREQCKARHHSQRLTARRLHLFEQPLQLALTGREIRSGLIGEQLQGAQHRRRDHQAHGLNQAEPLIMGMRTGGDRRHQRTSWGTAPWGQR